MSLYYYREKTDITSPASAGFDTHGGRAMIPLFIDNVNLNAITIKDLLGYTEDGDGSGRIHRQLPRAHPQWQWMFCSGISNIVGIGTPTLIQSEVPIESTALPAFPYYDKYLLNAVWEPKPYAVVRDEDIDVYGVTWYDEENEEINSVVAAEWLRYTTWRYEPAPELITAQQGQMVFRQTDSTEKNKDLPHLVPFPGHPRMIYPKTGVKFRWYQVPLRYLESSSSNLIRFIGRLNQLDWYGWSKGSLLYDGLIVSEPYTPPIPVESTVGESTVFTSFKLVDLEFIFVETDRENGGTLPTISNRNYIGFGHNLVPWLHTRKFFYATSTSGDKVPSFLSFPFELLFTDPDI